MRQKIIATITIGILVLVGLLAAVFSPAIFGDIVREQELLKEEYRNLVKIYANRFGVDGCLVGGVILTESNGRVTAQSHAGARGLMQIMPATAAGLAPLIPITYNGPGDLLNPEINITLGTFYLGRLVRRYGVRDALTAYNGGPGRVGAAYVPAETRAYPGKVLTNMGRIQKAYPDLCSANRATPLDRQSEKFNEFPDDVPDNGVDLDPKNLWQFFLS